MSDKKMRGPTLAVSIALMVLLVGVMVAAPLTVGAATPPTIDGLIDNDSYQQVHNDGNAAFYFYSDPNRFYFALNNKPNENVFGPNPGDYHDDYDTGWNNHTFGHLLNSDHVRVRLSCDDQFVDFGLDYLYQSGNSWAAGLGGDDSIAPSGTTSLLSGLQASSSLVWDLSNQATHGWDYTMGGQSQAQWQSPPFDPKYPTLTGTHTNWVIPSIYEFSVERAPFASCSTISIGLTEVHNSPPKFGDEGFDVPPIDLPPNTPTPTNTSVPLTATPTEVPPTATPTEVPPTATPTEVPPTATPTEVPLTATPTEVPPSATPTNTPEGPTSTPTNTPEGLTATPTNTPVPPTNTPVPPTNTPTNTPTLPPPGIPAPAVVAREVATPTNTPTPEPVIASAVATPIPTVVAPARLPRSGGVPQGLLVAIVTGGSALVGTGLFIRRRRKL